jgi:flavin reductase (DIM6/NTAB) family NADH-FMN oxidoreductase RutF
MSDAANMLERTNPELWIVTARAGERTGGLVATFVNAASIVPELPRVVVGIARQHYTWGLIEASHAFGLHLIDEAHIEWVWRFGLQSGRAADKFRGINWHAGTNGSPLLDAAIGWLDCRVETHLDTGDRFIYLAEVIDAHSFTVGTPLTLQRVLHLATPEQKQELRRQRTHDAGIDAAAIQTWRSQRAPAAKTNNP